MVVMGDEYGHSKVWHTIRWLCLQSESPVSADYMTSRFRHMFPGPPAPQSSSLRKANKSHRQSEALELSKPQH